MELNIENSIFEGLNDKNGLMICGYEWGFSKDDQKLHESGEEVFYDGDATTTFANKSPAHGERAFAVRYDNRILKWFSMWGHPLNREGLGNDFDKCVVQTNWCNSKGHNIEGNYFQKLMHPEQLDNFIYHIKTFEPSLIFFMGSEMIKILQNEVALSRFSDIMGKPESVPEIIQKPFHGRRFKIGFQKFEKCDIVSLPHPSSSHGLSDDYISLYTDRIGGLIADFKKRKKKSPDE